MLGYLVKFILAVLDVIIGSFLTFCAITNFKKGAYAAFGIYIMLLWMLMCQILGAALK